MYELSRNYLFTRNRIFFSILVERVTIVKNEETGNLKQTIILI